MITIKNNQRKIDVDTTQIKKDTQKLLNALGYADFDLGIWLTTNPTIKKYNRDYRKKDSATDILSFPFWPNLQVGEKIKPQQADEKQLGDLIISLEYVQKDAKKLGVTFNQRMKRLLIHGICHLLGYDHMNEKDYQVMLKKERELAPVIGLDNINE